MFAAFADSNAADRLLEIFGDTVALIVPLPLLIW
jgi:hypothetical protein